MASQKPKPQATNHVNHTRAAGAIAGEVAGAVLGSAGGPVGAVVGMVVGGLAGTLAGDVLGKDDERAHAHDEELDKEIGVSGGDLGTPPGTTTPSEPSDETKEPWPELSEEDEKKVKKT
jgi:hypothetical protein